MKSFRWTLWALSLALAVGGSAAVRGQSLADVAKKEQDRRKGVKQEPPLPVLVEGEAQLGEAIAREIRSVLLFTPEVRMVAPQALPRSDYKVKLLDYSEAS